MSKWTCSNGAHHYYNHVCSDIILIYISSTPLCCIHVCVCVCVHCMLYMRQSYFVGKQHDGRKIPPKFALNPCWDVLESILRKTKWLASWHSGHFVGFLHVFIVLFSAEVLVFWAYRNASYVKSEFEFFCLFRGLTIYSLGIQKNSNNNKKLCFSLSFHWLQFFLSSCFMGSFGHGSGHIIFSVTCMAMCRSRRWRAYWMSGTLQLDWWILWCALTRCFILIWAAPSCMCRACVKTLTCTCMVKCGYTYEEQCCWFRSSSASWVKCAHCCQALLVVLDALVVHLNICLYFLFYACIYFRGQIKILPVEIKIGISPRLRSVLVGFL